MIRKRKSEGEKQKLPADKTGDLDKNDATIFGLNNFLTSRMAVWMGTNQKGNVREALWLVLMRCRGKGGAEQRHITTRWCTLQYTERGEKRPLKG